MNVRTLAAATVACFLFLPVSAPVLAEVYFVTTTTDDLDFADGTCTLREAMLAANGLANVDACPIGSQFGVDTIYLLVSGRIELVDALPAVNGGLKILGYGPNELTIDANGFGPVLTFDIDQGGSEVVGVTLTGGMGSTNLQGGGIDVNGTGSLAQLLLRFVVVTGNTAPRGAGIHASNAALTLEQVTVSENQAASRGGGLYIEGRGAFFNQSAIVNNSSADRGGGIYAEQANIVGEASTVSGNTAGGHGGGLYLSGSTLTYILDIDSWTITENQAGTTATGNGGGLFSILYTLRLKSSILAGNTDMDGGNAPDVFDSAGSSNSSEGFNLIGISDGAASLFTAGLPNTDQDAVGTSSAPLDADLGVLADNGGPTLTHLPNLTSTLVLDQGSCAFMPYDQRGFAGDPLTPARPNDLGATNADDGCDIGSVERGGTEASVRVTANLVLAGAYDPNVIFPMNGRLGSAVPTAQPYNTPPWNYAGTETQPGLFSLVDWVLASLIPATSPDPTASAPVLRRALVLTEFGVAGPPAPFLPTAVTPGLYYLQIEHRNHVGVVTREPQFVSTFTSAGADFTDPFSSDVAFGVNAQQLLSNGASSTRGLWAGNADGDGLVTGLDALLWQSTQGQTGYQAADFDMDGDV
ncbi:MAG: CSLREA domain-containing protein, partial [Bacteroidota bacterium]